MTMVLGLSLCLLAVIGAGFWLGRWIYRRGWDVGFNAASGKTPVTPLRPKVEPRVRTWWNRGGNDAA